MTVAKGASTFKISLSGHAAVFCVHDRQKRQVKTEADVAALGLSIGVLYDPKQHKLYQCTCCENLFVSFDDEPKYCSSCRIPPIHALGGPLPEPKGVID